MSGEDVVHSVINSDKLVKDLPEVGQEFSHYGVLGMRWGVRRQPDGSKARTGSAQDNTSGYEPDNPGIGQGGKPAKIGSGSGGSRGQARQTAKSLSTPDLQERINRIRLERQYVDLTSKPSKTQQGFKHVNSILGSTAKNIAVSQLTKRGNNLVDSYVNKR